MSNDLLFVGAIVHFILTTGECRPAIVVKIWDKATGNSQLQVFMDGDGGGYNDNAPNVVWETSISYSAEKLAGTWHWPHDDQE